MQICISKKCVNKEECSKHYINNKLEDRTYQQEEFISKCDKEVQKWNVLKKM